MSFFDPSVFDPTFFDTVDPYPPRVVNLVFIPGATGVSTPNQAHRVRRTRENPFGFVGRNVAEGNLGIVTPLVVPATTITVLDSAHGEMLVIITGATDDAVAVADAVSTALAEHVLRATPAEALSVTDTAAPVLGLTRLKVAVHEAVTVTSAPSLTISVPVFLVVFDTVNVVTGPPATFLHLIERVFLSVADSIELAERPFTIAREAVERTLANRDFVRVQDAAWAQAYIGGGLGVRVAETVTVRQSDFYIGLAGYLSEGIPDDRYVTIGPNPGVEPVNQDYWESGV